MDHPTPRKLTLQSPLVLTVVASLVLGGAAGGAIGWLAGSGRLGGTPNGATSTVRSGTVKVTEDSATVDVVQKVSPAVVSIVVTKDYSKIYGDSSPFDFFGFPFAQPPSGKQEVGGGTGFIVSKDGLIVTNKHVVDDPEAEYTVVSNDRKRYDAKVVAQDPTQDIAIVKVDAKDLPTVELGDSDSLKIGQSVIAIGNALGQYQNTVTKGIVSGLARTITAGDASGNAERLENVVQTDAAINPGNSGGPLVSLAGQVVGMNTAVNRAGQLVGFAIPINAVKRDLESVEKSGKITRAFLGVRYVPIDADVQKADGLAVDYGALIQRGGARGEVAVIPGSPADKAGLVENDIILEINGAKLDADHSLAGELAEYKPGDTVSAKVLSKGKEKTVTVTLGENT